MFISHNAHPAGPYQEHEVDCGLEKSRSALVRQKISGDVAREKTKADAVAAIQRRIKDAGR